GAATTRGEFLAKQQGDFYLAAAEADGAGATTGSGADAADGLGATDGLGAADGADAASAADACCPSPLDLWRETLHEREATYMAESRDEERRGEDVAGGGVQAGAVGMVRGRGAGSRGRVSPRRGK